MDSLHLPNIKKKAESEEATIVYEDEASFRQSPTLHQTWAPLNSQPMIPTKGQRNTQKVLGAVELESARFVYRIQEEYFNYQSYISYLQDCVLPSFYRKNRRVYLIQDNASYHKKPETYAWFSENRKFIEVTCLPPYQPELNATERLWHHTRMKATHNRYHESRESLVTSLKNTFEEMSHFPELITGYLKPFF